MRASICICTHDRSADARECLEALLPQVAGPTGAAVEVILVDSASSGGHATALAALAEASPGLTFLRLSEPGLSRARNAAIRVARGDWVAFLDDDAVPFPDYVAALLAVTGRVPEDVAVLGGRLVGRFPDGRTPGHIGPRWSMFLSLIDRDADGPCTEGMSLFGANLAYRRAALPPDRPFREDLGRTGTSLLSGEELELHHRLAAAGHGSWYCGSMGAFHKVSAERLTRDWVRRRAYWGGVTEVAMERIKGNGRPRHLNPVKLAASLPVLLAGSLLADPGADRFIRLWYALGALRAGRHLAAG
ncbi:MAG: glycosyltransferase family 2 protein [Alphaproteobacteria bacterium]|nr:glycosyltransferase family 2 protein [Alphaproteobacteria bacterium]